MAAVVHGQPNIYCLFLALAAKLLQQDGHLVAITPRSFCNGLYFREFRRWFFSHVALSHVHLFESRTTTFREAKVLQENVIALCRRTGRWLDSVKVTTSHGRDFPDISEQCVPTSTVMQDTSKEMFVCIPKTPEDAAIIGYAERWPMCFKDIGLRISTGPVVMF